MTALIRTKDPFQSWFLEGSAPEPKQKDQAKEPGQQSKADETAVQKEEKRDKEQEVINPPLEVELTSLDPDHAFFQEKGLEPETVKHFRLGYYSRGLMKGRIAFPIRD